MAITHKQYLKWQTEHYYVYILTNSKGEHYIGMTSNPERRLEEHRKSGRLGYSMKMIHKRYIGNVWQANKVETCLKKETDPISIMQDDDKFYNWKLRLDASADHIKSANMKMLYSKTIGII